MPTAYSPLKINGVISTDKSVLQNLNDICTACGAFLTFDISQGKWAVVINTTGSSIKSYNNTNIIGPITVTETGVSELYNDVRMEFPHKTLRDQTDFVEVAIPAGDRFPNELDNQLQIQTNLINDPVQAQYIAAVELKQSRLNKIVNFTTDYTSLGLKAGDLIDVTSTIYGFTSKIFRVIQLEEVDDDVIGINITAMEYDEDVYSTADLVFKERTKKTGILLKQQNDTLKELDDADVAGSISRMIAANIGLGIANSLLNKLFGRRQIGTDANGNPIFSRQTKPADAAAEELDKILGSTRKPPLETITSSAEEICEGQTVTFTVGHNCSDCLFDIPAMTYPYSITGVLDEDVSIPLTGTVTVTNGTGTLTVPTTNTAGDGATYTSVLQSSSTGPGTNARITVERAGGTGIYTITLVNGGGSHVPGDVITWAGTDFGGLSPANDITIQVDGVSFPAAAIVDFTILSGIGASSQTMSVTIGGLNTSVEVYTAKDYTFSVSRSAPSITEGSSVTVTLTATGSRANSLIPYAITGTATSKVSIPLTGTVTTSGGTATLVVTTTSDGLYEEDPQGLTITFEPNIVDPCNSAGKTTSVTVLENDSVSDGSCVYVSVPLVWCGAYNTGDNQLKAMTVRKSVLLPVAQAGETSVAVPIAVSVSKGNPSVISVTSTVNVAAGSNNVAGQAVRIITSFNNVSPLGLITGTTTTLYGYTE
jgi:hypothetical protein